MSINTNGKLTTLHKLVSYIQAEESERDESHHLMSEDGQLATLRKKNVLPD